MAQAAPASFFVGGFWTAGGRPHPAFTLRAVPGRALPRNRRTFAPVSPVHPSVIEARGAVNRFADYESKKIVNFGPARSKHAPWLLRSIMSRRCLRMCSNIASWSRSREFSGWRGIRDFEILRAEVDVHGYDSRCGSADQRHRKSTLERSAVNIFHPTPRRAATTDGVNTGFQDLLGNQDH